MATLKIFRLCMALIMASPLLAQDPIPRALDLIDLHFTPEEIDMMSEEVDDRRADYQAVRKVPIANSVPPALLFDPLPTGFILDTDQHEIQWDIPEHKELPANQNDLAFYSISELASLIKQKKITSTELTRFFLDRLSRFGDSLECVVTLTDSLALAQAQRADEELATGFYRGPLHGIPYGIKDLFAVAGYPTTWGAMPYKGQRLEENATVVRKLEEAGAVLVAKLTLGALAMGDIWYGGVTKNPWNLEEGSSGSSAGSASATVAGLVPFAIGTETLGSIVSPSTRCGATGLRPTFGRVSRAGAMALSWSMDKIGPICRNARDCAIVFDAIRGVDGDDPTTIDASFKYQPDHDISGLKIGYFENLFDPDNASSAYNHQILRELEAMGVSVEPVSFDMDLPVSNLRFILIAEAAAAFDELTRSGLDDQLVAQGKNAWPNAFRQARLIPAVEYIQANRIRTLLIQKVHELMSTYDVIVTPTFSGSQLLATNLTGHPVLVMPNGFNDNGSPHSITFVGNLFDEHKILQLGAAYQDATTYEDQHPEMFSK